VDVEMVVTPLSVEVILGRVNDRVEDRRLVNERRGKLLLLLPAAAAENRGRGAYGCWSWSCP
jgi:hypothetical protein